LKHLNRKFNYYFIITFILCCFTVSCGSVNNKKKYESEDIDKNPKIIFLTFSISQDKNGNRTVEFVSQKTVNGKIKTRASKSIENGKLGDLVFNQLDKKSNLINSFLITDPLNKIIEFVDESKQFQTKTINATKTQFSLRLQLKNTTKYITISNFAEKRPLIKTKIN
jgi:hypothetical protein